jgi:hypothetical protein
LAQVVSAQVVLVVEQQVQVELRPVTAAADLRPVPLVRVALRPVTVAQADLRQVPLDRVALQPVTVAQADLHQVPLDRVALQPVTVAQADLHQVLLVRVALQPVTVAQADLRQVPLVRVALRLATVVAVAPPQERLLRVANRGRNFSLLLKSAVSVEWAESVPWGQQAAQGPVRWVCEAERPGLPDQGLVEPAGPDCS